MHTFGLLYSARLADVYGSSALLRRIATAAGLLTLLSLVPSGLIAQPSLDPAPDRILDLSSLPADEDMEWTGEVRFQGTSGDGSLTVSNISEPRLLAYLPDPDKATGTGIVIAPGGGFHFLAIENEGTHVAEWLRDRGIAAFVLEYRVIPTGENPREEFMAKLQSGQEEMDRQFAPYIELAKADGKAAVAYLREHAAEYGIDEGRIGIVGFSAGGTVAAAAGLAYGSPEERPDFIAPIYGALHVLELSVVPREPMPLFLAVSSRDGFGFQRQSLELFRTWNEANAPAELHVYQEGNHGFGMRRTGITADGWIETFHAWLADNGF